MTTSSASQSQTTGAVDDGVAAALPLSSQLANLQLITSPLSTNNIDIHKYIKFKLDAAVGNWHKWRNLFLCVLSKINARDHVEEETSPHLATEEWRAADVDIVLWIYGTISDELQDVIMTDDGTAFSAWQALQHFFTENAEGREIHLAKEFENIVQGDMTVVAYCRKLKSVADQLGDVNAPVTDKKLTMRLIAGLGDDYKMQGELLETMKPFPTFMQARSRLQLAEEKLKAKGKATPQILNVHNANAGPRFNDNCYTCGQPGHPARNCPTGGRGGYGQQPGRGGYGHYGQQQARGGYHGQQNYGQLGGGYYGNQGGGYNGNRGGFTNNRGGRGRGRGDYGGRGDYNPGYGNQGHHQGHGGAPYGMQQQQSRPPWVAPNSASVLGPRPGMHTQAYPLMLSSGPAQPVYTPPTPLYVPPQQASFDYSAMFQSAPSYTNAHPAPEWVVDSGATTHVTNSSGNLTSFHSPTSIDSRSIVVGNGSKLPIYSVGSTSLPPSPFTLRDVLVSPSVIKNLISVRKFTVDNLCSIEFDPYGFSVKDLATGRLLLRSNSRGDLYPFHGDPHPAAAFSVSTTRDLWHKRLGHPSDSSLSKISSDFLPSCVNVVTGKWIFQHKTNPDGSLSRYKARWVLRGFTQQAGVDYDETFSPVVKPATIRVQYALELLDRANMLHCNPISTPVDTRAKLSANDGTPFPDAALYRSLAGALQYLTLTRPDIAYAVQQICLFMHCPKTSHYQLIKRVLRYLRGTTHLGLQFFRSSSHELTAYSDADWAGCPDTRKSTSGFCVFLGSNLATGSSNNCILRQRECHVSFLQSRPTPTNEALEIDLHFVRDRVALGEAKVLHVPTTSQFADIFTKGLPSPVFTDFRSSLNIGATDVQSAGGCWKDT
ncbi:hypothetical protein QYE76_000831 [Lolium multiflorum]|uniref:CCHC-type domain-containing protein n=1 Tax=Lolium multiflorum TaxID=4521 RepID=A0AAD8RJW9_LOLMU|nr:hypothetical protein QYE76_000789 [Lolium multiflorum]KAK1626516.1 hypothetical protein QYE76_000831 [Lolium multiflorum]